MTPEKFFDYLEGKLSPAEKERLERALIADPELQKQFVAAREVHRGLERSARGETVETKRAGNRGRQLAAAFAVLVAMNVALGLLYIFRANKPTDAARKTQEEALRQQLQKSVEKSAAALFTPPVIGMEKIVLQTPRAEQETFAQKIIAAAAKAGGSGTKGLPEADGFKVLVVVPASAEREFRQLLTGLGGPSPAPAGSPALSPDEPVYLEVDLTAPR